MTVSLFWQDKYKREAGKNWDRFYGRNRNRFFKDRHWLQREFPELATLSEHDTLLEVGCGVGNLVFPVAEATGCKVIAADFSEIALQILRSDARFTDQITTVVNDFGMDALPVKADLATLIFVLSAVPPERHMAFLCNVRKSTNIVLFRDYAVEDAAQKRFAETNKMSDVLFVRQDGTLAYYFDMDYLSRLADGAGFIVDSMQYVSSRTVNRREGLCVERRFLQCRLSSKIST